MNLAFALSFSILI